MLEGALSAEDRIATAVAAVVMFGSFLVELVVSGAILRDRHHDLRDTRTNVVIGGVYVLSTAVQGTLVTAVLLAVWSRSPLRFDMRSGWHWLLLLGVEDFLYYWSHRASHCVRFMWGSHVVHHSSEKLNLGTGMRNSWVGGYLDWVFFVPLAALGFHPLYIAMVQAFATAWDFLCHTPYVGSSRALDWFFNSPANHRVHHSSDEEHANTNLGGFLIVWDRLFGTYRSASGSMRYGTTPAPLRPHDPIHLEFHLWAEWLSSLRTPPANGR